MSNKKPNVEKFTYEAEVTKVMDIVINSLYTDKEIFVRELISNAADAMEKMRHIQLTDERLRDKDIPLEIRIDLDSEKNLLTISDTGVGMTREELVENLGTIAHSGAAEFLKRLADNAREDLSLIGQFGVGFYSVFMAGSTVTVQTRSYQPDSQGLEWVSEGKDGYTIAPKDGLPRGTKITVALKSDAKEFAEKHTIQRVIKTYSNFVPFPILLDGEKINTVQAIWTRNKTEVKAEEYTEFYKFISGDAGEPMDWLHFSTDAPLSLDALLFIPTDNIERYGFGQVESRVDLHCRRVMIRKKAKDLLPQWLRFLHGIIDSEDIPLNISRETMQDSALIHRINTAITKRFIKHLKDLAKNDPKKYLEFWKIHGSFIKEGIISDFTNRENLGELLRFETSKTGADELISLNEYVERMKEDQKEIYFINGENRTMIEASPYMEVFRSREIEVIYNLQPVDDFVMSHLREFQEKKIVSAESDQIDLPKPAERPPEGSKEKAPEKLSEDAIKGLGDWIRKNLQEKILEVKASERLVDSPMLLVNTNPMFTGAMERVMKAMQQDMPGFGAQKRRLEFNPSHPAIKRLDDLRYTDEGFAEIVVHQLFDQAALAAGMDVETETMIRRMNRIIEKAME